MKKIVIVFGVMLLVLMLLAISVNAKDYKYALPEKQEPKASPFDLAPPPPGIVYPFYPFLGDAKVQGMPVGQKDLYNPSLNESPNQVGQIAKPPIYQHKIQAPPLYETPMQPDNISKPPIYKPYLNVTSLQDPVRRGKIKNINRIAKPFHVKSYLSSKKKHTSQLYKLPSLINNNKKNK